MDTREFLGLVLPEFGNYVLTLSRPAPDGNRLWNSNYESLDTLADAAQRYDAKPDTTVYFAVGCHQDNLEYDEATDRTKVRRTQATAFAFKTLCFDLDIGPTKPYATPREGVTALLGATAAIGLPDPVLVSSGYGIHGYYPLTTALSRDDWVRLSTMLRLALCEHDVEMDWSKIHDPSMVLRPAGTHNKKDPDMWRDVRVLTAPAEFAARDLLTALQPWDRPLPARAPANKRPSAVAMAVLSGDPLRLDTMQGCQQIAAMLADNGATADEPMWRGALGIAKYCDDPEAAILHLCGGHEAFDYDDSKAKMDRWAGTGPTTCEYFERINPAGCQGCKFKGQFKSPARLSAGQEEVTVQQPAANVFEEAEAAPVEMKIWFPKGFSYSGDWIVHRAPDADDDTPICPYLMYPEGRYINVEHDATIIRLKVLLPVEGWRTMELPADVLAKGGQELVAYFGQRQVFLSDGLVAKTKGYLMSYLMELQKLKASDYLYDHFGWQRDGTFLTGDEVISPTGEQRIANFSRLATTLADRLGRAGDRDKAVASTAVFDHPDLKYHGLVYLMGVGAPILHGSGLSSLMVNMYAPDSGSGKTTTGHAILAAFGKPSRMQFAVKDTDNSLYKSIGTLRSFGAYIDEITMADPDRLRDMIYYLPQGREKTRMDGRDGGLREVASWCMPVITSSNRDVYASLDSNLMSEAEKMRVLQFPFRRVEIFNHGGANIGYKLIQLYENNHGHVGPELVRAVMAEGGPQIVFERALQRFSQKYQFAFAGPERFWQAAFVIADAAGELMARVGLIDFDYQRVIRHGLDYVHYLREEIARGQSASIDIINQYLIENAENIIQLRDYRTTRTPAKALFVEPLPRQAVARVELVIDDRNNIIAGAYFLNRSQFRRWCMQRGADYRRLLEDMDMLGVAYDDQTKHSLYRGTSMGVMGQARCLRIDPLTHPSFLDALSTINRAEVAGDCKPRLAVVG